MTDENHLEQAPVDVRHLAAYDSWAQSSRDCAVMGATVGMLGMGLTLLPTLQPQKLYANSLGAQACFQSAFRGLRACGYLLSLGFYGEVRGLLRSVYESASLGRMLAKEPETADRWLRKREWIPDARVKRWQQDMGGITEDEYKLFSREYARLSAWAHPTATSTLWALEGDDEHIELPLDVDFQESIVSNLCREITMAAFFSSFAFRNAAVDEAVLDPDWRKALYDSFRQFTNADAPHLERDWVEEGTRFNRMKERLRATEDLESELQIDPRSYKNITEEPGKD